MIDDYINSSEYSKKIQNTVDFSDFITEVISIAKNSVDTYIELKTYNRCDEQLIDFCYYLSQNSQSEYIKEVAEELYEDLSKTYEESRNKIIVNIAKQLATSTATTAVEDAISKIASSLGWSSLLSAAKIGVDAGNFVSDQWFSTKETNDIRISMRACADLTVDLKKSVSSQMSSYKTKYTRKSSREDAAEKLIYYTNLLYQTRIWGETLVSELKETSYHSDIITTIHTLGIYDFNKDIDIINQWVAALNKKFDNVENRLFRRIDPSEYATVSFETGSAAPSTTSNKTVGSMTSSSSKSTYTTDENVVVTWSKAANATRYGLTIVNNATNEKVVNASNFTGTSYTVGKLPAGTYRFNMCGYNPNGNAGPVSEIKEFTVKASTSSGSPNDSIMTHMKNTYTAALKSAGMSSFDGWCGECVGQQLKVLGINTGAKITPNGNDTYSRYANMTKTSGGYTVNKYPPTKYTLKQTLNELNNSSNGYTYAVLCFDTGNSSYDGQTYGHTLLIYKVSDGYVYYTEAFVPSREKYCWVKRSIDKFCSAYSDSSSTKAVEYKFDGMILFNKDQNTSGEDDNVISPTDSYAIDVNGHINGSYKTSLNGYVTFDVYINGSRVKNDVGDFNTTYVDGTTYEIKDIKPTSGYKYVSGESLSGKINGEKVWIYINIANDSDDEKEPDNSTEWSEWSTTKPESKEYRTIESKIQYGYYHYVHKWTDTGFTGAYPVKDYKIFTSDPTDVLNYHEYWSDSKLSDDGSPWKGGGKSYDCYPNKCCSLGSNVSTTGRYLYDLGKTRVVYRYKDEEPKKYTIIYDANGGSGAPKEQTKTAGEDLKLSSTEPTRNGYKFLGWATSKTGNVKFESGDKYTDDKNITLYAVWEEIKTYTIKYNANGGSDAPSSQTKTHGESIKISSQKPTRSGYEFDGWATSANGNAEYDPSENYTKNGDITLYAVWKPLTYKVTYNANGGTNTPTSQTKIHNEKLYITDDTPERDGYSFVGWATTKTGSVSYKAGQQYTSDKDITLYAVWEANTYTISYNANGGSSAPKNQTKKYAESIKLSTQEPTRKDYIFLGWSTSAQGSVEFAPGSICSVNENITLYALWQEEENEVYYIIYNANGGKNAPSMQTKNEDEDITISEVVPTREGYTFDGWAVGNDDTVVYSSEDTYKENKTLYLHAVWTANTYTISYNATGGVGAPRNQTKIHDEDIALSTVEPEKENCTFIGWSDVPYAEYAKYYAEDTFSKNSDTVLYAVWEEIIEEDEEDEETNDDKNQSQKEIPFEDVPEDAWYRKDVENAYKNGLINGKSENRYAPNDNMTYAEAIKLACTIYQLYYDGEVTLTNGSDVWYSTYMDYALENRIVRTDYSSVANEYVTRKEFVNIFYGALPLKEFAQINNVDDNVIPDVKIGDAYSGEIYTFYRAGILAGNDAKGTFKPDSNISRSEVAAIVTRMLDSGARKETNF